MEIIINDKVARTPDEIYEWIISTINNPILEDDNLKDALIDLKFKYFDNNMFGLNPRNRFLIKSCKGGLKIIRYQGGMDDTIKHEYVVSTVKYDGNHAATKHIMTEKEKQRLEKFLDEHGIEYSIRDVADILSKH